MAKLSARNRKELARVSKERFLSLEENNLISWQRTTLAFMSDGNVLKKQDVAFRESGFIPAQKHSYGWKAYMKAREGITPEQFVAVYEKSGYTKE